MAACGTDDGQAQDPADPITADILEETAAPDGEPSAVLCEIEPTIASLTETYFGASCSFSSCHSEQTSAGGLDLSNPEIAWSQLVNVPSVLAPEEGLVRVVPGDPDASFLVQKVEGPGDGHGVLMPQGATEPLDPDCRIAMLREWILQGAVGGPEETHLDVEEADSLGEEDTKESDGGGPIPEDGGAGSSEPDDGGPADAEPGLDAVDEDASGPSPDATQEPDEVVEDEIPEESCDADLLNDPEHCGACGHSCMGALCFKGMCAPAVLASGEEDIQGVDVAGG
ncbi:MAG: hypothetical protein VX938_13800, partial [Myxococcota bacterium]|nr:hypothetical protein [Myxococcota bacterium]